MWGERSHKMVKKFFLNNFANFMFFFCILLIPRAPDRYQTWKTIFFGQKQTRINFFRHWNHFRSGEICHGRVGIPPAYRSNQSFPQKIMLIFVTYSSNLIEQYIFWWKNSRPFIGSLAKILIQKVKNLINNFFFLH